MKPGIDPKVDYAFKKVFGSESNVDLLKLFLEAVLGFPLSAVEIVDPFDEQVHSVRLALVNTFSSCWKRVQEQAVPIGSRGSRATAVACG